jgi:AcrR family transcriptional regulator
MSRSRQISPSRSQRRPGRPASLDRERIVAAAARLGASNLTMKALGAALGVSDAALYHYFPSRAALIAAVVDAGVRGAPFPQDRGQDWREWLREFAVVLRELLLANPGSTAFGASSGPTSPQQVALVARAIGVLTRAGFERSEAAMVYSLVSSFVISSVHMQELRAAARSAGSDIPARFARAVETLREDEARLLEQVVSTWLRATPEQHFRFGLEVILDGVAVRLQ